MSGLPGQFPPVEVDKRRVGQAAEVVSPEPPPLLTLDEQERQIYDYICSSLREAGIEHVTAGMPIAIIVRTFKQWLDAVAKCESNGRTQESRTGWHSPTPWAEDEKRLKMELGQWLPKACLTIPSLVRVRKDTGAASGQDDLFADLVAHATNAQRGSLPN